MTILAIAHFYIEHNAAGGELYLHRLLRELAKRHQVHVWVTHGKQTADTTIDGVKVYYRNPGVNPDVVVSHFIINAIKARLYANIRNVNMAWVVHNDDIRTQQAAMKLAPNDLLIFNTQWISDITPSRAERVVLHPPASTQEFKTTPGDHITLVNLTPEKGSDTFYALAKALPNEKFLGVTGGYFQDKFDHRELPNVEIIPQTLNMRDDVYARSKIVLMPSIRETYGMVAAEAFCSAIPVIAHPTKGLKENLGQAGIYIDRDNTDEWVKAIKALNKKSNYQTQQEIINKHMAAKDSSELAKAVAAIEALRR